MNILKEPAYPIVMTENMAIEHWGFTKRELGAFMVMQGLCLKYSVFELKQEGDRQVLSEISQQLADTLLNHLDKTEP